MRKPKHLFGVSDEELAACTGDSSCPNHYPGGDYCCAVTEILRRRRECRKELRLTPRGYLFQGCLTNSKREAFELIDAWIVDNLYA